MNSPLRKKPLAKARPVARAGRPTREGAARIEERILDAAEEVFLSRGFEGASIDEVAHVARAGKTTIYARYAGKKDLFAAVALRNVSSLMRTVEWPPLGATLEARLRALGCNIIQQAMSDKTIHLFRVTLSEAERFPDVASQVSQLARERGIDEVARLLGELNTSQDLEIMCEPEARPACRTEAARIFMDLIVLPMVMRRLFGESPAALQGEIADHVSSRVAFFLAASCSRFADKEA